MTDVAERLAHLARSFRAEGFVVRDAPFFSDLGIGVATRPDSTSPVVNDVIETTAFVYATPQGWQLRVTQHGGPHWVRDAALEFEVANLVREYLKAPIRPPGPGWREV